MKALITVGTPHLGSPAAVNVQNGVIAAMIGGWVSDLSAGPLAMLGSGERFARDMLEPFGFSGRGVSNDVNIHLQTLFGGAPAVDDLKPGSSFLNTLNYSPNNTLPAARYAIWGNETKQGLEYGRLAESFNQDRQDPIENGAYVKYHRGATTVYLFASVISAILSGRYFYLYNSANETDPDYFTYYDRAVYWAYVAKQWALGYFSLTKHQQQDWDEKVIGNPYYNCNIDDTCKQMNDGLLIAGTQAPSFFGSFNDNILQADNANHLEETAHSNVARRLREVFVNPEVNIEEAGSSGGGDDGGGGTPIPCKTKKTAKC